MTASTRGFRNAGAGGMAPSCSTARHLHEVYLPHFKRVVDEGVASIMSAYNSLNGEWAGQNRDLLTGILCDQWGFQGFVQSDWMFGMRGPGPL